MANTMIEKLKPEEKKHKSITDILDEAKTKMCNQYCRYPFMQAPEGKDEDWLVTDPNSPCMNCPLDML